MVVTDGDLVFKLLSLPSEALQELLELMSDADSEAADDAESELAERLSDPARRVSKGM